MATTTTSSANIKVTLHSIADEIYLAAPLGKLLGRESGCADLGDMLRDFNNDLALKQVEASRELAEKAYRIVDESLVLQQETVKNPLRPYFAYGSLKMSSNIVFAFH